MNARRKSSAWLWAHVQRQPPPSHVIKGSLWLCCRQYAVQLRLPSDPTLAVAVAVAWGLGGTG